MPPPLTIENLGRFFPNMAPREFGGAVLLPGTKEEAGPTTLSHEGVHAALSNPVLSGATLGGSTGLRVLAGLLPDEFNPEEELAYRLESPRDPYALKLRASSRRAAKNPALRFLSGLYGD